MKKYILGFAVFSLVLVGSSFSAQKAQAGLTSAQVNAVINLLNAFGASSNNIQSIYTILAGTGTPSTAAGTFTSSSGSTPTSTPGSVNPGAIYPYGTTPTTSNSPTTPNGCLPTNTTAFTSSMNYYNTINGYQCVKSCTVFATAVVPIGPLWNVVTNSLCPTSAHPAPTPTSSATSMTLSYPNGGESFDPGESIAVKWESSNIPATNDNVFILLNYYDANGVFIVNSPLASNVSNDGGTQVDLPTTLPAGAIWGNHFKVSIGTTTDAGVALGSDYSDATFTIE